VSCITCHANNVYAGLPSTCVSCHLTAYQQAQNPNHIAAGFPTTCETCHKVTDTSWSQGVFNHTRFPIASGSHSGNPCSACHTNTSNYQVFTCLSCHARAETDSHHRGRAGYVYDSQACYSCHPQGRAG
jgi:DnaJ-class molecular chaperone